MNKISFLFLLVMTANAFSQKAKIDSSFIRLQLPITTNNSKSVILLDNDRYRVTTNLTAFLNNFKRHLAKYPHLKEDNKLYKQILKDTSSHTINAISISSHNGLSSRLNFRAEELLENGECLIFDKKRNIFSTILLVLKYSYVNNHVAKTSFYIDTNLLLEIQDIVDEEVELPPEK